MTNFRTPLLFLALVLSGSFCCAQAPAPKVGWPAPHAPIPPAILNAKKIFIGNGGADGGLFPSPFSGDPSRGYDEFYAGMRALGDFELVSDPAQADLVMELRLIAPYGPTNASKQRGAADPLPYFRLEIYDQRTRYRLWALTESIEMAMLQKTHDRNFDLAVGQLVSDFQALTHSQPSPTP